MEARASEDVQDAELVRVAAYAGLRRRELVALRWRDVDFVGPKVVVRRALSGDTEVRSTKSRRARQVPLPDQAATALDRLSRRGEVTGPDDYVFASRLGRRLDPSALRRRYERARPPVRAEQGSAGAGADARRRTKAGTRAVLLDPAASRSLLRWIRSGREF
ncbi:MAG TPA: tyrosine-type recombinase/integrase [Solirubrobacteraceae bacterium]|nr:tyrosine-type recombinase/integrase [Solirubrobacteraceae bacterium]